jgi:hypothetical protein
MPLFIYDPEPTPYCTLSLSTPHNKTFLSIKKQASPVRVMSFGVHGSKRRRHTFLDHEVSAAVF